MMQLVYIIGALVVVPLCALLFVWHRRSSLPERHHAHHDTYTASTLFIYSLSALTVCITCVGVCLTCALQFEAMPSPWDDVIAAASFFAAFSYTLSCALIIISRYSIQTYENEMHLTTLMGATYVIPYADIVSMYWTSRSSFLEAPALRLCYTPVPDQSAHHAHPVHIKIWALLDIDQILLRINRFDVLHASRDNVS